MKLRVLNWYIGLWTFWFETYEEDKELIFDEDYCYFFINAKKRAKEIANETGRIVIIRKTKLPCYKCKQYFVYPDER